ncbi:hypothetical protein [Paenibacillus xylanexedens]|uniref:hypothetical protein n=1 Tax=Paenibacillus xylanexedens TaxID=528191 RepID=UPI0011A3338D|nr:hypothetical protein [Paenibacillus xylanexedens]
MTYPTNAFKSEWPSDGLLMDYILNRKTAWLESEIMKKLSPSLGFSIQVPEPFIPSDSAALFMPFAKVVLAIPANVSATETINLFNQKFQVLEYSEQDGYLTLLCMSPEGPYAATLTHVVANIRELLCPPFMHFFNKHDLKWQKLTFILTDTEL